MNRYQMPVENSFRRAFFFGVPFPAKILYFYSMAHAHASLPDLLKQHGIRQTRSRLDILGQFASREHALSQPDLEKALGASYDRVTIYRTLTLYLKKGLLHQVLDDTGAMKYALCKSVCGIDNHHHDHVHFKCDQCGQTMCLNEVHIPAISLPNGFRVREKNLLMTGVCGNCTP